MKGLLLLERLGPGLRLTVALFLALALLISLAATPAAAEERPSDHQYKPRGHDNNNNNNNNNKKRHNNNNGGGGSGFFVITQDNEQEAEGGDADQSFAATSTGDNSDQCAGLQGDAQTGNAQDLTDLTQVDGYADDFAFDEAGSTLEASPEASTGCTQEVNEGASAASDVSPWYWDGYQWLYWDGYNWASTYWDGYQWLYWDGYNWVPTWSLVSNVATGALDAARGTVPLVALGTLALIGTTGLLFRRNQGRDD